MRRMTRRTLTRERMEAYSEKFCNPFIAARLGYIDDVILPEETGSRIRRAFDVLAEKNKPCGRKRPEIFRCKRESARRFLIFVLIWFSCATI